MSQKKWFMLFLSQLSVLCLISLLLWWWALFTPWWSWYQWLVRGSLLLILFSLWRRMSILFFDEDKLALWQRILMIMLLPATILYFSLTRTILLSKQQWSPWLLLLRTVWRLFVIISLVFIKGTIKNKDN